MPDGEVTIVDKAAFPGKVQAILSASAQLRTIGTSLQEIVDELGKEASSFTSDGKPAPAYAEILDAVKEWKEASSKLVSTGCDSAENCVRTAQDKFNGIVNVDDDTAAHIQSL